MSSNFLERLPVETLSAICAFLAPPIFDLENPPLLIDHGTTSEACRVRSNIWSLSLTSKYLHRVATPWLYYSIICPSWTLIQQLAEQPLPIIHTRSIFLSFPKYDNRVQGRTYISKLMSMLHVGANLRSLVIEFQLSSYFAFVGSLPESFRNISLSLPNLTHLAIHGSTGGNLPLLPVDLLRHFYPCRKLSALDVRISGGVDGPYLQALTQTLSLFPESVKRLSLDLPGSSFASVSADMDWGSMIEGFAHAFPDLQEVLIRGSRVREEEDLEMLLERLNAALRDFLSLQAFHFLIPQTISLPSHTFRLEPRPARLARIERAQKDWTLQLVEGTSICNVVWAETWLYIEEPAGESLKFVGPAGLCWEVERLEHGQSIDVKMQVGSGKSVTFKHHPI